ncbi:hypothetical protein P872_21930 [Rhodonellum psychrophilum GCM71 = DSM 17998]|uniref:Uncharacterized protein n=2 Tax=Rhodonellum TaxID=336827 RepID=U5BRA4_9BACT|nr:MULTISPECIES: hypothetical protein [Rhodonellum]ERM80418.1 hypothetical protein P872_21930 [Rhodonellum psychrophilum GCM71 = DSM 17998]SDZ52223.1 hypothetical protein SAMN05444412_1206 [Rhodonellum ikkaensis]
MEPGNIIYIIAIIIYFIYSAVKKGKKEKEFMDEETDQDGGVENERPRPTSFEDLLKEIRAGQDQRKANLPETGQGQSVQPATTPKVNKPVSRPMEPMVAADKTAVETSRKYGDFQGFVGDSERPKILTLDEQVRISSSLNGPIVLQLDKEAKKEKPANRIGRMLKDPATVKDAIILSEILNRKQF